MCVVDFIYSNGTSSSVRINDNISRFKFDKLQRRDANHCPECEKFLFLGKAQCGMSTTSFHIVCAMHIFLKKKTIQTREQELPLSHNALNTLK